MAEAFGTPWRTKSINHRLGPILFVSYAGIAGGAENLLLDAITGLEELRRLLLPRPGRWPRARAPRASRR